MNYEMLNNEQAQAVSSTSSRILVLAGAGTGKTATLTSRMVRLYEDGVLPKNMLALTFTKAAGQEMKERVIKQIGPEAKKMFCNTFHSFAVRMVQRFGLLIGYKPFISVYDDADKMAIVEGIIDDYSYKEKPQDVIDAMRKMHMHGVPPTGNIKHIIDEYQFQIKRNNAMDFDTLIHSLKLLLMREEVRSYIRETYTHVFVDEFQDSDRRQLDILDMIDPQNLFLVGDDFQGIYGFAGADVSIIMDIAADPEYEVIKLERNYRSAKPIVDAANSLIKHNNQTEKVLKTETEGPAVDYFYEEFQEDEAASIAEHIRKTIHEAGTYRDIAILARTNRQAEEMALLMEENHNLPVEVKSNSDDLYRLRDIKNLIAWMEAVVNSNNDRAVRQAAGYPKMSLSRMELSRAELYSLDNVCSVLEAIRAVLDGEPNDFLQMYDYIISGYDISEGPVAAKRASVLLEDIVECLDLKSMYTAQKLTNRIEYIDMFMGDIKKWEKQMEAEGEDVSALAWLNYQKLMQIDGMTEEAEKPDAVQIMTAHKSKGLEWDTVFVTGCNEKSFPLGRGDIEEERRLFYVAATRAKRQLILTRPYVVPSWGGRMVEAQQSRFIDEMDLKISLIQ